MRDDETRKVSVSACDRELFAGDQYDLCNQDGRAFAAYCRAWVWAENREQKAVVAQRLREYLPEGDYKIMGVDWIKRFARMPYRHVNDGWDILGRAVPRLGDALGTIVCALAFPETKVWIHQAPKTNPEIHYSQRRFSEGQTLDDLALIGADLLCLQHQDDRFLAKIVVDHIPLRVVAYDALCQGAIKTLQHYSTDEDNAYEFLLQSYHLESRGEPLSPGDDPREDQVKVMHGKPIFIGNKVA